MEIIATIAALATIVARVVYVYSFVRKNNDHTKK